MKRLLAALALVFCLSAAPAPHPAAQPPIWTIADEDTEITLFATVHALPPGMDWLSPAARSRLEAADTLILETVIPPDPMALTGLLMQLGTSPSLPPLAQRLPPATMAALRTTAARLGLPLANFDTMHPWLIAISLGEAMLARQGISSANGVEPALIARAASTVEGLETPEQQLGFFAALSPADQIAMLDTTLAEGETAKADVARLIMLWQHGNIDAIADEFADEAGATPALREALLTARNRNWASQLKARMARPGKAFVAVGAAHFGGPDGLLAMLRADGLQAKRQPGQ